MPKETKATFRDGNLELTEELGLDEGEVVFVVVRKTPKKSEGSLDKFKSSAGAWKDDSRADRLAHIVQERREHGPDSEPK